MLDCEFILQVFVVKWFYDLQIDWYWLCYCFQSSRLSSSSFDLTSSLVKVECDPAGQQQEIEVGQEVLDQESRVNHSQGAVENHNRSNGNLEVSRRGEEEEREDDSLLPEFSETLPHDWETIEGEIQKQMFTAFVLLVPSP